MMRIEWTDNEEIRDLGYVWTLVLPRKGRKNGERRVPLTAEELSAIQGWGEPGPEGARNQNGPAQ